MRGLTRRQQGYCDFKTRRLSFRWGLEPVSCENVMQVHKGTKIKMFQLVLLKKWNTKGRDVCKPGWGRVIQRCVWGSGFRWEDDQSLGVDSRDKTYWANTMEDNPGSTCEETGWVPLEFSNHWSKLRNNQLYFLKKKAEMESLNLLSRVKSLDAKLF